MSGNTADLHGKHCYFLTPKNGVPQKMELHQLYKVLGWFMTQILPEDDPP